MLRDLLERDPSPEAVYQVFGHRDVAEAQRVLAAQFVNPVILHGVDVSDWQQWPTWDEIPGDFFCTRLCDGNYADQMFVSAWQWAQGRKKWPGFYVLPDPRLGWSGQLARAQQLYARAGVTWGAPGHWWSIDDEPTSLHDQFGGQAFLDLCHAFEDWLQRPQLCYSGYYSPNRSSIVNNGIPWWIPWPPDANGDVPSWAYEIIVAHQWGVAGAGEVAGFPGTSVDVDQVMRTTELDRISLRAGGDDDMTPEERGWLADIHTAVTGLTGSGAPRAYDQEAKLNTIFAVMMSGDRYPLLEARAGAVERMAASTERTVSGVVPAVQSSLTAMQAQMTTAVTATVVREVKAAIAEVLAGVPVNVDVAKLADAVGQRLDKLIMRAVPPSS